MSTPDVHHDECGDIMSILGVFSTLWYCYCYCYVVQYTGGYQDTCEGLL